MKVQRTCQKALKGYHKDAYRGQRGAKRMQRGTNRAPTSFIMSQGLLNQKKCQKNWTAVLRQISFSLEDCCPMAGFGELFWIRECFKLGANKTDSETIEKMTPKLIQLNETMNPTRMQNQFTFWKDEFAKQ